MPHLNQFLLLGEDWWQIVGGIIFFVLYGVGQLLSGRDEAKKKARPRPGRQKKMPQPLQPGQPGAPGQPPNQADPLRAEVEEFLRRAQGKEPQAGRPAPPKAKPPARRPPPRETRPEPRPPLRPVGQAGGQPAPPPQRPLRQPLAPQQQPEPSGARLRKEGVGEHVARHISTREMSEHTAQLGEEVALADDRLEARLQEKFEHRLGSLQHREEEQVEAVPTIAEEVRQLLSQPAGMRQLIVAHEILRRPDERW